MARSLMSNLLDRGITTLVTTHHPDLKAYAHTTPGVINASVEFDLKSLRPTYHLTIGLPGRSNALAIASRLGLPDEIIQAARGTLDPADLKADDLLDEIHRQRKMAEDSRLSAEKAHQEVEKLRVQLADRIVEIEQERQENLEKVRLDSRKKLQSLKDELKTIKAEIKKDQVPEEKIQELEEKTEQAEQEISQPLPPRKTKLDLPIPSGPIQEGDKVYLRSLGKKGQVLSVNGDAVEIQVGILRVRAQKSDLERTAQEASPEVAAGYDAVVRTPSEVVSPGMELDLRGQRVDEALENLGYFLDKAFLAGLPWARIIHGMGTGKLRKAVREILENHAQVNNYEPGKEGEGGDGVTVVSFQE